MKATLVGTDEKTDLALLKVNPSSPLPGRRMGNSEKARVGEWVMAIGDPFGLGGTVTTGIISARNRDINAGAYDDFIQTDAPINRGNSGGPLFNMYGEVIGVNSAIYSPTGGSVGIGFAIPINAARNVITQLRAGGIVRRGWLGVRIQEVTDELAESLGLDKGRGALIAGMNDGGPGAEGRHPEWRRCLDLRRQVRWPTIAALAAHGRGRADRQDRECRDHAPWPKEDTAGHGPAAGRRRPEGRERDPRHGQAEVGAARAHDEQISA